MSTAPFNNNIPGSFPGTESPSYPPGPSANSAQLASQVTEHKLESKFISNQAVYRKTKDQHDILRQLEAVCYLLIFYQFVRFCYCACIIPTLCHIVQVALVNYNLAISTDGETFLQILFEDEDAESRIDSLRSKLPRFLHSLYVKTIFVLLYHTLFVCTWMVSLVNEEKVAELSTGTWWFVSFIGEEVPRISPHESFATKIVKLGLPQLLVLDLIILFIQLVSFQCIFWQSATFSGRSANEKEVYLIRGKNVGVGIAGDASVEDYGHGVILALKVRLYETLKFESFFQSEGSTQI
ncbi:uncharacterized protein LODBEIA_P30010 [Lodderomyces beijingensis]|uniref:Uncharacterized protein n=1 Tax=Lodderomyces beijingensis TaxID=1775926 RepID=A0ABP0ZRB7_9ASCO